MAKKRKEGEGENTPVVKTEAAIQEVEKNGLQWKDEWRKAKTIKVRVKSLGRFYPVTRAALMNMAKEGKLKPTEMSAYFTPESLMAFEESKPKTEA